MSCDFCLPHDWVNLDSPFPSILNSLSVQMFLFSFLIRHFPNFNSLSVQESQIYQSLLKPFTVLKDLHPTTTSYAYARKVVGFR